MKPFLHLMFAISSTASATTVLNYDWQTEQLSLSSQVNSGLTYASQGGTFSGTFSILFSGLGSIDTPVFFLTIPVDYSLFTDYPQLAAGSACLGVTCYSSTYGITSYTYLIQDYEAASSLEPLLLPISLTTSVIAQYHDACCGFGFSTDASATVTVDFGNLVLKDAFGNNITNLVSFTVTPPGSLSPEPSSFLLAGAGLLALAIRRIRALSR